MKILKRYKEENANWFETTLLECLDHTEGAGYWKKDSVLKMLKTGIEVQTCFSVWKIV